MSDFSGDVTPVVIIGAARSGTKFLRDTLAASREAAAVPYDVNYVWRYGQEDLPHDVLMPDSASPRSVRYIRRTLGHLAGLRPDDGHRFLIEKTVSNSLRPEFVARVLPDARYVHLIRDGRNVVESAMRMWREPADVRYLGAKLRRFPWRNFRYAFWYAQNLLRGRMSGRGVRVWGPRYPGIQDDVAREPLATVCARQWRESVDRSVDGLAAVPPSARIDVRYEALVSEEAEMERLCAFLGINDTGAVVDRYRTTVRPVGNRGWATGLSEVDQRRILNVIAPMMSQVGYAIESRKEGYVPATDGTSDD